MGKISSYLAGFARRLQGRLRRPHASPPAAPGDTALPVSASPDSKAALSPSERLFAQSERLFVCATQLLDDAHAAQQVVAETLHLFHSLHGQPGSPSPMSGAELERTLDRLLVGLTIVRLKALPAPSRTGSQRESWPSASSPVRGQGPLSTASEADEPGPSAASQLERTAQVLATLPVELRVAVMLVVMQSRTVAEAAELLGASEEACTFYLNNGRKLLRRALQRDLLTDDDGNRPSGLVVQPEGRTLHDLRRNKKAIARA